MEEQINVKMTSAEAEEFEAFKRERQQREAESIAAAQRDAYHQMVDAEIERAIELLTEVSGVITNAKKKVLDNFNAALTMKSEVLALTRDNQRSHTFTNSAGNKRVMLGVYVTDGYLDTVEDGIAIVREYIEGLATDDKSRGLVRMVMRLLSRDAKGTLKASRVMQLRKLADESGDARFIEGVTIIEESYQPSVSRQFVRAEYRDDYGVWHNIPLGMTEC